MGRFDLIVFDLDGTLIDSKYDLASSINYVRALYDLPQLSVDKVRSYVGDGLAVLMEKSLPGLAGSEIEIATIKYRAYYGTHLLETTKLYRGVKESLEKLSGVKKALLTNKPENFTKNILSGLAIEKYFKLVIGCDAGPKRKPDPFYLNEMLFKLKMDKGRCLMVGDGKNDLLAAKAAGIKCAAVLYGYTAKQELAALDPDYNINNFEEILAIV